MRILARAFLGNMNSMVLILKHDSLQKSSLGAKLRFAEPSLDKIFGDSSLASDFFKMQWEFITPMFFPTLLPRVFVTETILPFLGQESKGEGSFGKGSIYNIHPWNQGFPHAVQ